MAQPQPHEDSALLAPAEDSAQIEPPPPPHHHHHPYSELLRLALPAVLNQAARPLAALVTVGLVGHASCGSGTDQHVLTPVAFNASEVAGTLGSQDDNGDERQCTSLQMLAAFSAVTATVTFVQGIFNFLVTVTWAQLGKMAIGEKRWEEVGGRVRQAACVAVLTGCGCAAVLWAMRGARRLLLLPAFLPACMHYPSRVFGCH
jgi:Na+-driven multidrug efflux pump